MNAEICVIMLDSRDHRVRLVGVSGVLISTGNSMKIGTNSRFPRAISGHRGNAALL